MRFKIIISSLLSVFILSGCISSGGTRIDNVPMYGQPEVERPKFLKKADEEFIKNAVGIFKNREIASEAWYYQAEEFMKNGNIDYAMRRYNQSWLLNPNNYNPYWGFARVMVAKRRYDESFKYFQRAIELVKDPYQKPALLADTAIAYHNKANSLSKKLINDRSKYFELANKYFKESTVSDPSYPNSWVEWAFTLYIQGKYSEAWEKVKKARQLDSSLLNQRMLNDLSEAMPEPDA